MNHLDEGTIHAWLDGALDSAQSAEVESHVAACPECAGLVAEARGFIAASSRILGALDDDRANVIPQALPPKVVPIAEARRVRRTAPWMMAVAAVLVAAVVLRTTDASRETVMSEAPTLTSPVAAAGGDSAMQSPPPPAAVPVEAAQRPANRAAVPKAATRVDGAASKAVASAAVAEQTRMREVAPSAPVQATAKAEVGSVAGGASVPAAAAPSVQNQQRLVASLAVADADVAGCYPMPDARGFGAAATTSAGVAARTSERRRDTRAAAPEAAPRAAADFAATTRLVRIDSAATAGRAVRLLPGDSVVGSWRVVGDSVRVELGAGGTVTLARAWRTPCP